MKFLKKGPYNHVFIILLILFQGCGGAAPEILELRWRLNIQLTPRPRDRLTDNNTLGFENLSVFIQPSDEDGIEDLDSMYLINNERDLFWALDASQWKTITSANNFWVGSNQFSSGYLRELPRGNYRVELYDKSGERAQRNFEFLAPKTGPLSRQITVPPVSDELLLLLPQDISLYSLVGYNINNDVLFVDANYQSIISLKELKIRNDELDKVQILFEFPNTNIIASLGPYMVPRIGSEQNELEFSEPSP